MVKTKSVEKTTNNFKSGIGRAPQNYKDGVESSSGWQQAAIEGEDLYATKVQEAIANRTRANNISKVSDAEWKQAASEKGASRIGPGMTAAVPKYRKNMAKVLNVIKGVNIPKRTADPMANIDNRLKPIAQALADAKKRGELK